MPKVQPKVKKLYYSIGEVSDLTGLKAYVLRYWETEFVQLKPLKNRAGNRTYRQRDIDIILKIKSLLYDDKFTIEGARKVISNNKQKSSVSKPHENLMTAESQLILKIRDEIQEVINIINQ